MKQTKEIAFKKVEEIKAELKKSDKRIYKVNNFINSIIDDFMMVYKNYNKVAEVVGCSEYLVNSLKNRNTSQIERGSYETLLSAYSELISNNFRSIKSKDKYKRLEVGKLYEIKLDPRGRVEKVKIIEEFENFYLAEKDNYRMTILKNNLYMKKAVVREVLVA